jgi:hypothetical protein
VLDDAKSYFAVAPPALRRSCRAVEPVGERRVGAVHREFYARVRAWLAPGGVFGQWLHLYEIDDRLVLAVLAALHRNFAAYDIYLVSAGDVFVVATTGPRLPTPDWGVVRLPGARERPPAHAAARLGDARERAARRPRRARAAARPLADRQLGLPPVARPRAERTRFMRRRATGFREISAGRFDPVAAMRGWRVDFTDAPRGSMDLPRTQLLAQGAAVRAAWARRTRDPADTAILPGTVGDTAALRDALYRRASYEHVLATGRAPTHWPRFIAHALDVADDLHGGTAGAMDSTFFDPLLAYLDGARAPAGAQASVRFLRGLYGWRWAEACDAAEVLVAARQRGESWVRPTLLHDGAVVCALRLGDATRARRLQGATASAAGRDAEDLRTYLVAAWIDAAGRPR